MCYVLSLHIFLMANSKGIPRDPEKKARSRIGIFSIIMVLLVTLLMLLEAMAGVAPAQMNNPAAASANIQPNPTMNVNVTWSSFYNGWNPLEYSNGTANLTLNTGMSSIYANPVSIDPAKISGLTDKFAPSQNESDWGNLGTEVTTGESYSSTNASGKETITLQGSDSGSSVYGQFVKVPITSLPSNNPSYDYFTMIYNTSGQTITGQSAFLSISNDTNNAYDEEAAFYSTSHGTQTAMVSVQLSALIAKPSTYGNMNITHNSYYKVGLLIDTPNGTAADTWSITLQALILSENPLYLGTNATGAEITNGTGSITLSSFSPNFAWSEIIDNGYSVAVSQPLQNLTTQQSAVSSGSYVEQVEYQGGFALPTAPDLSYGSANLTEHFNVSTTQVQVLDINGVSYLSTISGKNGTVLLSSVNPNGQTQFLQIVDYTQSQWTSISSPPGIFTIQGIEYYWEEFIIAILAVVGIGAGAASKHASSLRKVK